MLNLYKLDHYVNFVIKVILNAKNFKTNQNVYIFESFIHTKLIDFNDTLRKNLIIDFQSFLKILVILKLALQ